MSLSLSDVPGLPDADLRPPTVAESGDPFTALRVAHLLARIERGTAVRLRDVVDQLNAEYLDWSFLRPVVVSVAVQLQANWAADFRTTAGFDLAEGAHGEEITIEDSPRAGPWLIRQVERIAAECRDRLRAFARDEGAIA